MIDDFYSTLGVDKNADPATIKASYKKLAKKNHPDAGGDAAKFTAIARAYRTLNDPDARAEYDQTGKEKVSDKKAEQAQGALNLIGQIFNGMIDSPDIIYNDWPAHITSELKRLRDDGKASAKKGDEQIKRIEKMLKRTKHKKKGVIDPLIPMMRNRIDMVKQALAKDEERRAIIDRALEIMDGAYSYEPEKREVGTFTMSTMDEILRTIQTGQKRKGSIWDVTS